MHQMVAVRLSIFLVFIGFLGCEVSEVSHENGQVKKKRGEDAANTTYLNVPVPVLPKDIVFCGRRIDLENFDVRERLDKEIIVNTFYHSSTIQILKRANRYFPEIEKILREEGLPDDLKYICVAESGLQQARSPAGARGVWQFMHGTAREYGLEITSEVDERMHVAKSTRAACDYLKFAFSKFNDWVMATASYNCGIAKLKKKAAEQGQDDFFDLYLNKETSRYILRIFALKMIMERPNEYGFDPSKMELYEAIETRTIEVNRSISNISEWANKNDANLRLLKVLNPWLIGSKLTYRGKPYYIELPKYREKRNP